MNTTTLNPQLDLICYIIRTEKINVKSFLYISVYWCQCPNVDSYMKRNLKSFLFQVLQVIMLLLPVAKLKWQISTVQHQTIPNHFI